MINSRLTLEYYQNGINLFYDDPDTGEKVKVHVDTMFKLQKQHCVIVVSGTI